MTDKTQIPRRPSEPCPHFCCSKFNNLVEDDEASYPCDLNNPINPVFAHKNFPGTSRKDYNELFTASLRLASRLIESDRAYEYVLTMAEGVMYKDAKSAESVPSHGRRTSLSKTVGYGGFYSNWYHKLYPEEFPDPGFDGLAMYPRPGQVLNHKARSRAKRVWVKMSDMVSFEAEDARSRGGVCQPSEEVPLPATRRNFPHGSRSKIFFDLGLLQALKAASIERGPGQMYDRCRRHNQFTFAKTLIHELGHALNLALFGNRPQEVAYKNECMCEAGLDFECAIFGGVPTHLAYSPCSSGPHEVNLNNKSLTAFNLEEWPSDGIMAEYNHSWSAFNARSNLFREIPGGVGYTEHTRITSSFVGSLFTEKYWEEHNENFRSTVVRPHGKTMPKWIFRIDNIAAPEMDEYDEANAEKRDATTGRLKADVRPYTATACGINDQNLPDWALEPLAQIERRQHSRARDPVEVWSMLMPFEQ